MKRVAVIGTVGLPAKYGGFETLVENINRNRSAEQIEYTVFCSSVDCPERLESHKGATLKYVRLHANGIQSVIYDTISLIKAIRGYDVVLVLGVSGGLFFPIFKLLSRSKFIVNIDGIEWRRGKWGTLAKAILYISERMAVRFADVVVADNQGIVDYVASAYKKESLLIAYGSDHVERDVAEEHVQSILSEYEVTANEYAIKVCRIEPENNCEMVLKAFTKCKQPLIFIGNWNNSEYGQRLKILYSIYPNINIVDAVYDLDKLHVLRANCKYYIHGHSAGGTNPSLVEAMYSKCNIIAYDVVYNRATTKERALYFKTTEDLLDCLNSDSTLLSNSSKMYDIASREYTWAAITRQYEALY